MPKLVDIEGVGYVYALKLKRSGVRSVQDLLRKAGTEKGRKAISESTHIAEGLILEWANQADLMRIKGISTQYAYLLEKVGVDNTAELAMRDPQKLHDQMVKVNQQLNLVQRVPSVEEILGWIEQALDLPRVIMY